MTRLAPAAPALLPIFLSCFGYLCFSISDAAAKYLGQAGYHFSFLVICMSVVMIIVTAAAGAWHGGRAAFVVKKKKLVLLRAVLSVFPGAINVYVMPYIQLTTFYTLAFTSPFFIAVLSALILREKLQARQVAAVLAGFSVILFIFQPGAGLFSIYALGVLVSAVFYSLSMIVMRMIGAGESLAMIVISGCVCGILAMLPFSGGHYVMPNLIDAAMMAVMGIGAAVAIGCIAYAYQHASSAASIAPYHYTQIAYGAGLGYLAFGEVPEMRVLAGAAMIVAAGLSLIYAEARSVRRAVMPD